MRTGGYRLKYPVDIRCLSNFLLWKSRTRKPFETFDYIEVSPVRDLLPYKVCISAAREHEKKQNHIQKRRMRSSSIYSFAAVVWSLDLLFSLRRARNIRRRIFPEGFLGISSTKQTPPLSRLCGATRFSSHKPISCASFCVLPTPWARTTYARGNSLTCSFE